MKMPEPALEQGFHGGLFLAQDYYSADQLEAYAAAKVAEERERLDIALAMLAEWCVAVDTNGTGWDDWDEHYKDAMYRPGPLRELLDEAIAEVRKNNAAIRG